MGTLNKRFVDLKNSFWVEFPMFKITGPFKDFYKGDKSSKKVFSSTIMWAITKCCDPNVEECIGLSHEEKITNIFSDFLEEVASNKIDWHIKYRDKLDKLMEEYLTLTTSKVEKSLLLHEKKFVERGNYLESLSYQDGDGDTIEKMLEKTSKIAAELDEARKKVMAEKDKGVNKGGVELSLSDKGGF